MLRSAKTVSVQHNVFCGIFIKFVSRCSQADHHESVGLHGIAELDEYLAFCLMALEEEALVNEGEHSFWR